MAELPLFWAALNRHDEISILSHVIGIHPSDFDVTSDLTIANTYFRITPMTLKVGRIGCMDYFLLRQRISIYKDRIVIP